MASPKTHAASTITLIVFWAALTAALSPSLIWNKNWTALLLVIFFGVLMDVDHLPFCNLKAYLEGRSGYKDKQKLFFHLWPGLIIAASSSFLVTNILPFLSYTIHILIDGGSREGYAKPHLPYYLHCLYPSWLKYETDMGSVETLPRLYQKFMRLLRK